MLLSQLRKIVNYLLMRHAGGEPLQYIINGNSGAFYNRLAKPDIGVNLNILSVINLRYITNLLKNIYNAPSFVSPKNSPVQCMAWSILFSKSNCFTSSIVYSCTINSS